MEIIDNTDPIKKIETDKQLKRHQQRLEEIKQTRARFGDKFSINKRLPGEYPFEELIRLRHQYMDYNHGFRKAAQETTIAKDNQKILEKLVSIHLGRGNNGSISGLDTIGTRNYQSTISPFNPSLESESGRLKKKKNAINQKTLMPKQSQSIFKTRTNSVMEVPKKTFHQITRQHEEQRIMVDNIKIVKRILGIQPLYSTRQFKE